MKEFFINLYNDLAAVFTARIGLLDILDIIIVTVIIYLILRITKETRARQVLKGLGIVIIIAVITSWLRLSVISWLLSMLLQWGVLIAVILFQPELRRILEQLGRGTFFDPKAEKHKEDNALCIDEMIRAIQSLSKRKVGALIVISQNSDLTDVIRTGTTVDAVISAMLLENIFEPNTPLHDGAMIVKENRVVAAGCFLPLSDNILIDRKLGTRHRAALGMSERSDAIIIVVSEETGVISYAKEGNLHRYLDSRALRELLEQIYSQPQKPGSRLKDNIMRHIRQAKAGEKMSDKEELGAQKEQNQVQETKELQEQPKENKEIKDLKAVKENKEGAQVKKKERRKLTSLITNNFWLKVISLVFAILIWSYVINETNPSRSAVFSDLGLSVNYEYSLRNSGLVLQNDISRLPKIRVSMDIPYKEYRNVKASNITVYIDLSKITSTGTYELPVYASCSNSEAVITSVSPSTVSVVVDNLATAEIPIIPSYSNTLPDNLYMQYEALISPDVLNISGPENYVSKIAAAKVDIDLSVMTDGYTASLPYTFIDSQGETISSASIEVADNRTSVMVDMGIASKKTVPIEYASHLLNTDKLAEGYEFESAEIRQGTVEIIGKAEVLANIDALHIEDIDMSGMDGTIKQINANLVIPDGVTILNPSPTILDITIGEQEISRQFTLEIQYRNLPSGFNYTASASQAQVVFSGNYFNINSITASDVQIIVDLSGLSAGTHTLQTDTWLVTDIRGISIESITPSALTVIIY